MMGNSHDFKHKEDISSPTELQNAWFIKLTSLMHVRTYVKIILSKLILRKDFCFVVQLGLFLFGRLITCIKKFSSNNRTIFDGSFLNFCTHLI